jgi:hypothetical protein
MIQLIHNFITAQYRVVILFFLPIYSSYAQYGPDTAATTVAMPVIGWDSLSAHLPYGGIAERAGITGAYVANVSIDTSGTVTDLTISSFNNLNQNIDSTKDFFFSIITQWFKSVNWYPATNWGKPINSTVSVPIVFNTVTPSRVPILNIEALLPDKNVGTRIPDPDEIQTSIFRTSRPFRILRNKEELDRIRIEMQDHGIIFDTSFISQYRKSGYFIIHTSWTPDFKYFVFNAARFEGEHPYHFPIYFFSLKTKKLYVFDDRVGYVTSNFELIRPNYVRTTCILNGGSNQTQVMISLDDLINN